MLNRVISFIFMLAISTASSAQSIELEHTVKVTFDAVPLEQVLETMSRLYDYKFSYIPEKMPLSQQVNWKPGDATNPQNIENFLLEQHIQFKKIGDQYILRYEENSGNLVNDDPEKFELNYIEASNAVEPEITKTPRPILEVESIGYPEWAVHEGLTYQYDPNLLLEQDYSIRPTDEDGKSPIEVMNEEGAQISLFGSLGTSKGNVDKVNKASLNVLYGHHGGVDGFEIGAGVNHIDNDVKGIQVAGLGNVVGGEVTGFQGSGAYNQTKNLRGVQLTSGINVVNDTLEGMQISSFVNIHKGQQGGFQFSSFINSSKGNSTGQVAGLYNQSHSIDGVQLAPINKAMKVDGIQIGLINIADTVSGASIGLINFVKKGYKHLEIYHTESLHGNLSYTFGSQRFYNRLIASIGKYDGKNVWGFGYGLGSNLRLSDKNSINLDLQWQQINRGSWSNYVNFLNTFSVNLTTTISERVKFFMGPSANLYVKRIANQTDTEAQIAAPDIYPYYSSYQTSELQSNFLIKGWVGWKIGFRFF